jgi:hypothetical protein
MATAARLFSPGSRSPKSSKLGELPFYRLGFVLFLLLEIVRPMASEFKGALLWRGYSQASHMSGDVFRTRLDIILVTTHALGNKKCVCARAVSAPWRSDRGLRTLVATEKIRSFQQKGKRRDIRQYKLSEKLHLESTWSN